MQLSNIQIIPGMPSFKDYLTPKTSHLQCIILKDKQAIFHLMDLDILMFFARTNSFIFCKEN